MSRLSPCRVALTLLSMLVLAACNRSAPAPDQTANVPATTPASSQDTPAVASAGRPSRQYSIEEFVETVSVAGASFSQDESRILFSSNKSGVWNAYAIPTAGGEWTPVTRSTTDNNYAVAFFPADDRLLVTRDTGGNELNHLYVIATDGSEKDLTPGENLKAEFAGFTRDGKTFRVATNERDPKFFDLYEYDATTYERTRLFENNDGYELGAMSDDGRHLVLAKTKTTADNDLYLLDRDSGKIAHLTPHEGNATYTAQDFDAADTALYYTSNEGAEFSRLRRYVLADGKHEDVRSEPWDIVDVAFSHNGKYRVDVVNVDGSTEVDLFDAASGAPVTLPTLPSGEIRGVRIAKSETRMAFYLNGDRQPNDLYVLAFGQPQPARLTRSLNPAIDAEDLVDSNVARFKSFDGMEIPNILWKPHQATVLNKVPAVVLVHGGPGGQTTRAYNYAAQFLANNGYVVLGINNRGSSGYGQSFFIADDGKHGREPLWDCIEAKKYLQTLDYVDPERIGIMGGSYGGYMTLAALAFKPDEFKVGVDIFGVSNWVRTLENIPPYWESFREALYTEIGNPETQHDVLVETSPAFHGDKITRPLIVIQGANDPRVIKAESDDIVAAVKKNGVPVEYVVFDDEGHGFTKKKNQIKAYGAILKFLDTHLKGAPAKQG